MKTDGRRRSPDPRLAVADAAKSLGSRLSTGLATMLGSRANGRFGVLYYHRITRLPEGTPPPTLNVTPAAFRSQLEGLVARGFNLTTVGAILERVSAGRPVPARTAVVTFDDGFRGVWSHAWPTLKALGVPATLFVATAFMDATEPFPFDPWGRRHASETDEEAWVPLTWQQCAEMVDSGLIEIGSHSHTHADFRGRPADLARDLQTSLIQIRSHLGVETSLFSFPYGNVRTGFAGDDLARAAADAGLRCGLTTTMGLIDPRTSPFRWGRFEAAGSDTAATLAAKLDGWYSWMEHGRTLFQRLVP